MKRLLVIVDMQNDFLTGALANENAERVLANVKAKLEKARLENIEVVFTRDTHFENYLSTQEGKNLPVPHCIKGTWGWNIADGLYEGNERVFDKPVFGSIELATFVKEGGYTDVEVVGVCTDICVVSNVLLIKAYCPETAVVVDSDCCAGVTKESHESALKTMASCQVSVL